MILLVRIGGLYFSLRRILQECRCLQGRVWLRVQYRFCISCHIVRLIHRYLPLTCSQAPYNCTAFLYNIVRLKRKVLRYIMAIDAPLVCNLVEEMEDLSADDRG